MNGRIQQLRDCIATQQHHLLRSPAGEDPDVLAWDYASQNLSNLQRAVQRFTFFTRNEQAVILPFQKIVFMRTLPTMPEMFSSLEWEDMQEIYHLHNRGKVGNLAADYAPLLKQGFMGRRTAAKDAMRTSGPKQREFLQACIECIDSIVQLCFEYAVRAGAAEDSELSDILCNAVTNGAHTLREALQILRIADFTLWCAGHTQNSLGRFDQYLLPYYEADKARGVTKDQTIELLQEFFLSLWLDCDLYSTPIDRAGPVLTLGGTDANGRSATNDLTLLSIIAGLELQEYCPRINLRVSAETPLEFFELGIRLVKEGPGEMLFSNDDAMLPALTQWGYAKKDACDYAISSLDTPVIPGKSHDLADSHFVSLPEIVRNATLKYLESCPNFSAFLGMVEKDIAAACEAAIASDKRLFFEAAPVLSIYMDGYLSRPRDISQGSTYNNFSATGLGFVCAADSLAAIKYTVFDKQIFHAATVTTALHYNFGGYDYVQKHLQDAPKVGFDNDYADEMLVFVTRAFVNALQFQKNERNGIFRPSAGTLHGNGTFGCSLAATSDGRLAYTPIPEAYEPMPCEQPARILSTINSLTKPNLPQLANGCPLIMPLTDDALNSNERIANIAKLTRLFILRNGHEALLKRAVEEPDAAEATAPAATDPGKAPDAEQV